MKPVLIKPILLPDAQILTPQDAEEFKQLRELIVASEDLYPGIEIWYDTKVKPDLRQGKRIGVLLQVGKQIKGAALFRPAKDAKLCSLRLEEEGKGYGQFFWDSVIELMRLHGAKRIHFTMPEHLWFGRSFFKRQKGVTFLGKLKQQFRNNDIEEVVCDP